MHLPVGGTASRRNRGRGRQLFKQLLIALKISQPAGKHNAPSSGLLIRTTLSLSGPLCRTTRFDETVQPRIGADNQFTSHQSGRRQTALTYAVRGQQFEHVARRHHVDDSLFARRINLSPTIHKRSPPGARGRARRGRSNDR